MKSFGAPIEEINDVIWGRIVPGVGITLLIGNTYYTWMGIRLTNRWGRPYTAQPYGLNTPQAFAFVFNVMCTYYYSCVCFCCWVIVRWKVELLTPTLLSFIFCILF